MKSINISLALLRGLQAVPWLMSVFCLSWQWSNSYFGQQAQQVIKVTPLGHSLTTQMTLDKHALVNTSLLAADFATDYQPLPQAVGAATVHQPRPFRFGPEPLTAF
ncbi:hypothetical protein V9N52_004070 [Vibrio navarrensis]